MEEGVPSSEPSHGAKPTRRRAWRRLAIAAVLLVASAGFVGATAITGLPGPGPLRRYPASELRALVDAVHDEAGPIRTPDDCWRMLGSGDAPLREVARVDHLRSRVVVRAWAGDVGVVDPVTRNRVAGRLDAIVAADPAFESDMLIIEPSPDGWSTDVSCSWILQHPVTGF